MKTLYINSDNEILNTQELDRILSVCKKAGYVLSRAVAIQAWLAHCDTRGANALPLPEKDTILLSIIKSNCVLEGEL